MFMLEEKKMKMKKMFLVFGWTAMGAVLLGSCASKRGEIKVSEAIETVTLDYKGRAIGAEKPDWVEAANNDDYETLSKIPRFAGKVPIVNYGNGRNLDLLRSWVNNFNVQAEVSRRIVTTIDATFGGGQLGDKNTPENNDFVKEIVATFSATEISGLGKEMDFWIKERTIDRDKKTSDDQYTYYVVYSISEEDLNNQIDRAMGKIVAKTKEQEEIKAEANEAIKRAKLRAGIQPVE
jgi:hypothetical protein